MNLIDAINAFQERVVSEMMRVACRFQLALLFGIFPGVFGFWIWLAVTRASQLFQAAVVVGVFEVSVLLIVSRIYVEVSPSGIEFCNGLRTQFVASIAVERIEVVTRPILPIRFVTDIKGKGTEHATWLLVLVASGIDGIDLLGTAKIFHGRREQKFYEACDALFDMDVQDRHIGIISSISRTRRQIFDASSL